MSKNNLTPDDKKKLIEALNKGVEPSPDLLPKLFPCTAEKFDVQALDRAKIPTLEYSGKRSRATILAEAGQVLVPRRFRNVRCFGDIKNGGWRNLIVQGDNLQFLKTCYKNVDPLIRNKIKGKVKLVYIDPPFATKGEFGGKDGQRSYADKVDASEFTESLRERLIFLRELLAEDGSIYLHLDQKMSHYVKIIMDEVFDKNNFINEIIWSYDSGGLGKTRWANKHDVILFYAKTNNFIFNVDRVREPYKEKCKVEYKIVGDKKYLRKNPLGRIPHDVWDDVSSLTNTSHERLNYPTQKPELLIEKIVEASSNEGDLVLDCFAGAGTTAAVAEKLGRRWISCDFGKHSIYTMQKRILNIAESNKLGNQKNDDEIRCEKCNSVVEESNNSKKCSDCQTIIEKKDKPIKERYAMLPKPFCIISSGAYDFSHVMDLRKHKDTYIDFVLGLFQLSRDDDKVKKYKLANIYTLKDGDPVEVYPVWDDQFLKEVKIDGEYLRGIIAQSGGRLKGDYFIITPESCANVGDTVVKNPDGKDVNFQMLTFPYKVLEDISRTLELQEQPSSQDNVNNLITSTAFYFNEDVALKAKRVKGGLQITKFDTKILNKEGKRFEGFSGIAMLLVDLDYAPGKPFDMDVTVFAKEIEEDGLVKIDELTKKVGLIAIDKHGNESKPFELD